MESANLSSKALRSAYLILAFLLGLFTIVATGGGGSGSSGGNTDNEQTITATVVVNPNNVLSVYVDWTTESPMDSEVQFGVGGYQYRIHDDSLVTSHHVLVIGMHAETTYLIKAVSSISGITLEDETSWTTGSLPIGVPEGTMLVNDADLSQPGWTLMNVQVGNGDWIPFSDYPAMVVMYDHDGLPVWYYTNGTTVDTGGAVSTEFLDNNNILIGPTSGEPPREVDLAGNIIWEGPEQTETVGNDPSPDLLSHHVGKLSNGNYLLLRWMRDTQGDDPTDARLEEVTVDNQIVWEWNLYDFITPPMDVARDWCHANSATVDLEKDAVYLSCRWLGLFKTTYDNPELEWHMPATYYASGMGDVTFVPSESQFMDIHNPEIHDDGTILFFDNDGWDYAQGPGEYHSRILEFEVDETTKEAVLVWEFPGDFIVDSWFTDEFYCPFWGGVNRLDNGNILVTAGVRGQGSISHVFEVTRDGEVVWDFTLPEDHGVYQATRISPPPLIEPL